MKGKHYRAILTSVFCFSCVLIYINLTTGHHWGDDFAAYIMQAQAVVDGTPTQLIQDSRFTIEQSTRPMGPVAYPWGFPVLLAPFLAVFHLDMVALKAPGIISYLLFLPLLAVGFRKVHSHLWLTFLVSLFALNPTLIRTLNQIESDIPFLLVSTAAVLLMGAVLIEGRRIVSPVCDRILLGALIAISFFIRSNGILLLATCGCVQSLALAGRLRQRKDESGSWTLAIGSLVPRSHSDLRDAGIGLLPWVSFLGMLFVWRSILPVGGASHLDHLSRITVGTVTGNLKHYAGLPPAFFQGAPLPYLIYLASIPFLIVGLIRRIRVDFHIVIYVLLTVSLYILWPVRQDLRFLFPVLPFYCSFVLTGLSACRAGESTGGRKLRRVLCVLPVILVLACFLVNSAEDGRANLRRNREYPFGPFTAASAGMFSFIEQNTEADSVVIFFKPRAMRMLTGRRSLQVSEFEGLSRGDYLCLCLVGDPLQLASLEARMRICDLPDAREIYENTDFRVYRLGEGRR